MRILVTGSRAWDDTETLTSALNGAYLATTATAPVTLVHGACPRGADALAAAWVTDIKQAGWLITEERHPADWASLGKRAGFARNAHMVGLGADICLAFIRGGSRGATHTADLAERAGIPTRRWTS